MNFAAYDNRAVLHWKQHKPSVEIVPDFETSLRINPGNKPALFSLVNYYYETGDYNKAMETGNHYIFQYGWDYSNDSANLKIIKRIILKVERNEKLHILITAAKAMAFYDSVNTILKKSDSIQQRFINNVGEVMMQMIDKKSAGMGVDYLNKNFDSSVSINEISMRKISLITEIDSSINYKRDALNYCLSFKKVYKDKFGGFIYCLKSQDFVLIKNCIASIKPSLFAIRKAGTELKLSAKKFRKKYQF